MQICHRCQLPCYRLAAFMLVAHQWMNLEFYVYALFKYVCMYVSPAYVLSIQFNMYNLSM
jgi:hypothetical protein